MGELYRLVPDLVSDDTVEALEELLYEARQGRIIGLAFVAIHSPKDYSVDTTGEAKDSPTSTRGMLATLDDLLSQEIHDSRRK